MNDDEIVRALRALADTTRFRMVKEIAAAEELSCGEVQECFGLAQPTISHHLKILREAGLVESSRRGTWAYYRLVPESIAALRGALGA